MRKKDRYTYLLKYFQKEMPQVTTELNYENAFQLLVAVILSAQCTDKRVNMITPNLFKAFPSATTMAKASQENVYEYIKSVSYPNAKARHLIETSKMIVNEFSLQVPQNMDDLLKLPGVGRKTANVILSVAFSKPTIAVDTHVYRVSHRLGLVAKTSNTPQKVEKELLKNIPKELTRNAHHWLLLHGRHICTSRKPHCSECNFETFCPKIMENSKL